MMDKLVLIVEDNESMANLEKRHLEKDGFKALIAASGQDALEIIEGGDTPDLLIIDYSLPDMSGVELMKMLRNRGWEIPSIILTASGDEQVAVESMKLGAKDYIVKDADTIRDLPASCREVIKKANLERENEKLIEQLRKANAELKEANRRLEELSKRDDLTGLFNRRYLMESLDYEVTRSRRYRTELSLAIFDIDRFKEVNDTYGHSTGDMVLKQFAGLLRDRVRKTDILGRYGGEEFGFVLTETGIDSALFLCEEIREMVARFSFGLEHAPIKLTTSAGVACMTESMDREELIEKADKGLYMAKDAGRNCIVTVQKEKGSR